MSLMTLERELGALTARLGSLEELEKGRAGYTDAARMILIQANGKVGQLGAVADYLEVSPRYERAVEACLGNLLQYVIVTNHEQAAAGLALVREENAGRCGFLVLEGVARPFPSPAGTDEGASGLLPLISIMKVQGPYRAAIEAAIGEAWIAEGLDAALHASARVSAPIATLSGDVLRGSSLVSGGSKDAGRGILALKREIKSLQDRSVTEGSARDECAAEVAILAARIARAAGALEALNGELHREEKSIVGLDLQLQRANDNLDRLQRKTELLETERRHAEEQRRALDARQTEARESIVRLDQEQRAGDERLSQAQRRLLVAREAVEAFGARGHRGQGLVPPCSSSERRRWPQTSRGLPRSRPSWRAGCWPAARAARISTRDVTR